MANPYLQIKGIDLVMRNLRLVGKYTKVSIARGMKEGGKHLLRESMKIVPMWTGALRASGRVDNIGGEGSDVDIVVHYGGGSKGSGAYSVYVHEIKDPPVAHGASFNRKHAAMIALLSGGKKKKHSYYYNRKPEEQFKFLEKPAREERDAIIRIIRQHAKLTKR